MERRGSFGKRGLSIIVAGEPGLAPNRSTEHE
jgi:hypothetical protein